jgi:hypothetical protein
MTHRWPTDKGAASEFLRKGDGTRIRSGELRKAKPDIGPPKAGAFKPRDNPPELALSQGLRARRFAGERVHGHQE